MIMATYNEVLRSAQELKKIELINSINPEWKDLA